MAQVYIGCCSPSPMVDPKLDLLEENEPDSNSLAPQKARGLLADLALRLAAPCFYLVGLGYKSIQFPDLNTPRKDNARCILIYGTDSSCMHLLSEKLVALYSCGSCEHVVGGCHFWKSCGRKMDRKMTVAGCDVWHVGLNAPYADSSDHSLGNNSKKTAAVLSLESRLSII